MPTVLLPSWSMAPDWDGRIGVAIPFDPKKPTLQEVKEDWQPKLDEARELSKVEAFAFPTPFAWAETMSAVIRQDLYSHLLFQHYEQLVIGLMLGHLEIEIADMQSHAFGKVLAGADSRYQYFGLLRGRGTPENSDLEGKVFGGTSPDCLFWPSPRRTDSDWLTLRELVRQSNQDACYQLLADFRDLLTEERLWDPDRVPWMRAINHIVGARQSLPGHKFFHTHSRLIGPIEAGFEGEQPLYFPVYEKDFAANFLRGLTGSLRQEPGRIGIYDQHKKCFEVSVPVIPPGGKIMHAGTGIVRVLSQPSKELSSDQIKLADGDGNRGLLSYFQNLRRIIRADNVLIKRRPFFFPDVFRIPVTRLGEAGLGEDVSFSKQAYELTFDPDSPGLPLATELETISQETSGLVLEYRDENNQLKRAIYLDSYVGSNVGDLKALGWVLWSFFISGEKDDDDPEKVQARNQQLLNYEFTPIFKATGSKRPFDLNDEEGISSDIYKKVKSNGEDYQRLAAQQRFLKAYQQQAAAAMTPINMLCLRSVQAFIRWVWPQWMDKAFLENGHLPRAKETIKLGNLEATLLRDE